MRCEYCGYIHESNEDEINCLTSQIAKLHTEVKLLHEAVDKSNTALVGAIKTTEELTATKLQIERMKKDESDLLTKKFDLDTELTKQANRATVAERLLSKAKETAAQLVEAHKTVCSRFHDDCCAQVAAEIRGYIEKRNDPMPECPLCGKEYPGTHPCHVPPE